MRVMKKYFLDERRGRVSGGGGSVGDGRSKFGEGIKSEDKLKRTMESSLKKKQRKIHKTRREFQVGSIANKRISDVNQYTDRQSAYDIFFLLFCYSFFSPVYFVDRKKTVTLTNALVVIFTKLL